MTLSGKVALVTGASRGIGAACAETLAANGASVAVNYVQNQDAAAAVVDRIRKEDGKAIPVKADVRSSEQVLSMVSQVEAELGPVDILVNNANISFSIKPFTEFSWDEMEAKLTGEMKASFFCCQAVVQGMIERGYGRIINISSGLSISPGHGFLAHTTAKSGLNGFTRALALELGPAGITVNTVSPGLTETDATSFLSKEAKEGTAAHTPMKRIGLPGDVAGAVLLFATDHLGFVTGSYLPVDGGITMPQ